MNPIVIKVGGAAGVDAEAVLRRRGGAGRASGQPVVLVHGTSAAADALATACGRAGAAPHLAVGPRQPLHRPGDAGDLRGGRGGPGQQAPGRRACSGWAATPSACPAWMAGCWWRGARTAVRAVEERPPAHRPRRLHRAARIGQRRPAARCCWTPATRRWSRRWRWARKASALNVDGDRAAALLAGALGAADAGHPEQRARPAGQLPRREQPGAPRRRRRSWTPAEAAGAGPHEEEGAGRARGAGRRRERGHPRPTRGAPQPLSLALAGEGTVIGEPGSRIAGGIAAAQAALAAAACGDSRQADMDMQAIIALESAHTSGVYPKRPLAIVRGQGARLWDADGREYIDCVGGQGAANLGHAHPAIVAAISRQAATLISCPEIFYNDRRAELLARAGRGRARRAWSRAFLCNSGTEAVEAAIKFARLSTGRHRHRRRDARLPRPDHGRAVGDLEPATTASRSSRWCPASATCPTTTWRRWTPPSADDTAAVLLEVVQGEGGVHPADAGLSGRRAGAVPRARRAADPRRGADRLRPHRQAVRLRALRRRARPDGGRQVDGRRPADGRLPDRPARGRASRR